MHPSNPYLDKKPDFAQLAKLHPSFAPFVTIAPTGYASIDFQNPAALRALTAVLLKQDWGYDVELREDRLCPTIANRLDYLYHILDLEPYLPRPEVGVSSSALAGPSAPSRRPLRVLDVGTGHIAIYALLLHHIRPSAQIVATELDAVSFHHSFQTLQKNNIPSSSISLRRPTAEQPILFPIFDSLAERQSGRREVGISPEGDTAVDGQGAIRGGWDVVICNPPFFGSADEMKEGREGKAGDAPAAPTAADNELITPGGEVAFVGQMIKESLQLQEDCTWYTSLIGKYSSLAALVDQLKDQKVDNYFVKICRQARTTRWILGWSHTSTRLPDNITRPSELIPGTSFARLLPPPNTFSHTPAHPSIPLTELRRRVEEVQREVQLLPPSIGEKIDQSATVRIAPGANTWSRAARRQAARGLALAASADGGEAAQPLFRAEIRFLDAVARGPTSARGMEAAEEGPAEGGGAEGVQPEKASGETSGGTVELHWLEGRDRVIVEGLWKFVLTKAGLVSGR